MASHLSFDLKDSVRVFEGLVDYRALAVFRGKAFVGLVLLAPQDENKGAEFITQSWRYDQGPMWRIVPQVGASEGLSCTQQN